MLVRRRNVDQGHVDRQQIAPCLGLPEDKVRITLPSSSGGLYTVIPGNRYNGAVVLRGYATAAGVIAVHGYVNRV